MANTNAPAPPRSSQTSLASDSYHTAPSVAESSADAASTGNAAPLVDLNPGVPPAATQQSSQPTSASDGAVVSEKRKCWICLVEEGESLPNGNPANTSRWTKPCACSLDAHESCLIAWVNQSRGADATAAVLSPFYTPSPQDKPLCWQ